jgi:ClpP class serine protease
MPNWGEVLGEINGFRNERLAKANALTIEANQAVDKIRRKYLGELYQKTGRNIIAYYSGWLSKTGVSPTGIVDEDKNGLMMAVHQLARGRGLDLVIHTPGGSIAATQSIVDYLRKMFGTDIRAIVPQIAMSAGTMIACSCEEIIMGTHSNLGPIDPQIQGRPAYGILHEFKKALKEIKDDPAAVHVWRPILSQYEPTLLTECENAITWSNQFVSRQLRNVMFRSETPKRAAEKAAKIVKALTDFRRNGSHSRHIEYEECEKMGLKVRSLEKDFDDEFQDLVDQI